MPERSQWIVAFAGYLSDEGWDALNEAGIRHTDLGPPIPWPAVLVEATGPDAAEARVFEVLDAAIGNAAPPKQTHPVPAESKEADELVEHYLTMFDDLGRAGDEMVGWALRAYGAPPTEPHAAPDLLAWAVVTCYGAPGAFKLIEGWNPDAEQ
jgi:hypothetical protein